MDSLLSMIKDYFLIAFSGIVTIAGGLNEFSSNRGQDGSTRRRNLISLSLIILGAIGALYSGINAKTEEKNAEKLAELKHDSIISLNNILRIKSDTIVTLQHDQLDSLEHLLYYSLNSNLLQEKLRVAQAELYNQVTGGNHIAGGFTMYIMINESRLKPILNEIPFDTLNDLTTIHYMWDVYNCCMKTINEELFTSRSSHTQSKLENPITASSLLLKLIEGKIIKDLGSIQTQHEGFEITGSKTNFFQTHPVILKRSKTITPTQLQTLLSDNQFIAGIISLFDKQDSVKVPLEANLAFEYTPKGNYIGSEKIKIVIAKRRHFKIELEVVPQATIHGINPFKNLKIPNSIINNTTTYPYRINMSADFDQVGSSETAEFKKWTRYLFTELEKKNSL